MSYGKDSIDLDPENYNLLKDLINETYLDGMDRIEKAWVNSDGSIEAITWDENRQFVVDIGDDISILQTNDEALTPIPKTASFAASKKRNCKAGIACGGTCISKTKTCRKKTSESQKAKAEEIVALVHIPKKVEKKGSDQPPTAKGGSKKSASSKSKPKASNAQKSDKLKESALMDESFFEREANNPQYRGLIAKTKAHNNMIKNLGEVGDVTKMSTKDLMTSLLGMDGEERVDFLGVTAKHYRNKDLAKSWHREVSKKIHPDVNKHSDAAHAFNVLDDIYKNMVP